MKVRKLVGEELSKFRKLREAVIAAERKMNELHTAFQNAMKERDKAKEDLYEELRSFPGAEISDCGEYLIEG